MIRVRHPFRVTALEPRLAFAGSQHACDTGAKTVRLEAGFGVGSVEVVLGPEQSKELKLGRIVTVEIIGPDPMGELFSLEVGPAGILIESERAREFLFEQAKRFRSALLAVPGRATARIAPSFDSPRAARELVQEVIEDEIKKAIAGVIR